ncbi:uncharacterized protein LOC119829270 isoform X2 [Zerene cesonia]|uniref:uncharacterized protein LOC119829270 isoform X2 n=1 Tax=Zerene cesonia TaxID=33412 RepID=UPI0018E4FAC9|nr:uncharacterized protein LOC119829270 isoform X2 [Zerene cesonia]
MGQAGSQPAEGRPRRVHTLPSEPLRHAPKVLPSLTESPRLRSTDNGAILHSGGTISGRRPVSMTVDRTPHGHVHSNIYRSRSAGGAECEFRSEREMLHRSHTNLDIRRSDSSLNKRFGSEPDLREEEQRPRCNNKHFRKKYRAPPPPANDHCEGSSPDCVDGNEKREPQKKLRLFRTRNETKKLNPLKLETKPAYRSTYTDFKSLDFTDTSFERRYRSPCKDKDHLKYPDNVDMLQTTTSLKREERLLQGRQDYRNKTDRVSGCRAKASKTNENNEAWKTPLLNRNFRHSERFSKTEFQLPSLRREKTFDNTLAISESESPRTTHESRLKAVGDQITANKLDSKSPLRKSLPSLLHRNNEEKDEFQMELKKATSRIRNELVSKSNVSTKTSQNDKTKVNPTKTQVKESSLNSKDWKPSNVRRPLSRINEIKTKTVEDKAKCTDAKKSNTDRKENVKTLPDRGQASGKESTPEHSPTRIKEPLAKPQEKQKAPSKHFYFGMIESKQTETQDHLKDFPGLGSPIIEEFSNFHLIEKKLLGYHEEDELDKFNERLKQSCKRNLSSESALSSGSEGSCSEGSLGIALRLRPTLPKKMPNAPRFSPAAAWRQLASLDAHLAETRPLAVEVKMSADISGDSSPRSEQSADKSGDSGISGDHAHSDHRIDSPSRHHVAPDATWTPQQDLGDSGSEGAAPAPARRDDKGKPMQHGFNSLQKFRKSVSGALGAALGSRKFDLEHEPMLNEPEQNWFLTKSAPNSLSNPMLFQPLRVKNEEIKEESEMLEKEESSMWRGSAALCWGAHVMYLPPAPDQPHSLPAPLDRPVRSKSSGCLETAARAARAARAALAGEMRERERSASPELARAVPARVEPVTRSNPQPRSKRFTFQSTVRQLERRRLAEKLSKEADLKEQQRKTELEAMRRVEEEFQRKRAREKANIRQQLRLVSSGANSMPTSNHQKSRDDPDGSCRESPERNRDKNRTSNGSDISGRSKSSTPVLSVELSEWRTGGAGAGRRVYRDWSAAPLAPPLAHAHPPACARMPLSHHPHAHAHGVEGSTFSGSPRSDNYRLEFALGGRSPRSPRSGRSPQSPCTPRPPRLLATRSPSTSGSEISLRQPIKISETTKEDIEEPIIVPTLRPTRPARASVAIR